MLEGWDLSVVKVFTNGTLSSAVLLQFCLHLRRHIVTLLSY